MDRLTTTIMDGTSLARRRLPALAERAASVYGLLGRAPRFMIVAFSDEGGHVPHIDRKIRACAAAGVDVTPLIIPPGTDSSTAVIVMRHAIAADRYDAVFVQVPFPDGMNGDAIAREIPVQLDVDVMTAERTARFMNGADRLPPVTVTAGLLLLDEYRVSVESRAGIVVADENPFSLMFRAALVLRGADMAPLVPPGAPDLEERLAGASLVIVAAGAPGLVKSGSLAAGSVAIDVGYFNPGGIGDIDVRDGIDHLAAFAPVPGGIGPMTVSALLERVIEFAERRTHD